MPEVYREGEYPTAVELSNSKPAREGRVVPSLGRWKSPYFPGQTIHLTKSGTGFVKHVYNFVQVLTRLVTVGQIVSPVLEYGRPFDQVPGPAFTAKNDHLENGFGLR
jgi:hypothetical protein